LELILGRVGVLDVKLLCVVVLQWLEDNNVQRLDQMCEKWWQAKWDNVVILAVFDELPSKMGAMAAKDQEPILLSQTAASECHRAGG
jgi:hypothetical protein